MELQFEQTGSFTTINNISSITFFVECGESKYMFPVAHILLDKKCVKPNLNILGCQSLQLFFTSKSDDNCLKFKKVH